MTIDNEYINVIIVDNILETINNTIYNNNTDHFN